MNGCIYPRSVPRCYPPEVQQECLHPRTSPGPGTRTSRTPSLGSRKSSLSNHSSRLSSCSSRSCSPRPRLRRESAQVLNRILVKRLIDAWLSYSGFWGRWPRSKHQHRVGWSASGMQQKAAVPDSLWQWAGPPPEVGTRHAPPLSPGPEPVKVMMIMMI